MPLWRKSIAGSLAIYIEDSNVRLARLLRYIPGGTLEEVEVVCLINERVAADYTAVDY